MPALTAQQRLDEARNALHELMTGTAAVEIRDSDGSSIRYTRADATRLRGYIKELEAEVAGSTADKRHPMRLTF